MAEVALVGEVLPLIRCESAAAAPLLVYPGGRVYVEAALRGGLAVCGINARTAESGMQQVYPGVRQGVYASYTGTLVDFTDWVWKMRFPPWCGFAPPVVRRLSVWLTPQSNDPTGREVQLHIDWGDDTRTERCQSGQTYCHPYAYMGRYTITVRATNVLGDCMALARDVVVVEYPDTEAAWRWGQSPGSHASEEEPAP